MTDSELLASIDVRLETLVMIGLVVVVWMFVVSGMWLAARLGRVLGK